MKNEQQKQLNWLADSHLQPAWISNKTSAIFLQAGLDAAPDFILCLPYLETPLTSGLICYLNITLKVVIETPKLEWKCSLDLAFIILRTNGAQRKTAAIA